MEYLLWVKMSACPPLISSAATWSSLLPSPSGFSVYGLVATWRRREGYSMSECYVEASPCTAWRQPGVASKEEEVMEGAAKVEEGEAGVVHSWMPAAPRRCWH